MAVATLGIQGRCAHCQRTLLLKPWQLNAIAINEAFTCTHCQKALQLYDPKQIRRFKSLDSLAMLKASLLIMICSTLLVALVLEWIGTAQRRGATEHFAAGDFRLLRCASIRPPASAH